MDSRDRVWRAVEFEGPDRVPFEWYRHGIGELDVERSDLAWVGFNPLKGPGIEESGNEVRAVDEWGCVWVSYRSIPTMGQPLGHPLQDWDNVEHYEFPELELEKRFEGMEDKVGRYKDLGKYIVGGLDFGIWERLHFLRGLKETVLDLYLQRDRVHQLLEILTEFKLGLIRGYSGMGVDCVGFTDDWGSQSKLMISPGLWVEVFKPYYERIFREAQRRGMHTYLHSCGNVREIVGHLIEAGLDIIQLDAPHQCDVEALSDDYAGKICFNCCIDIQKVLVRGVRSEIHEEARNLTRRLGRPDGGFIARQYPQLVHIGVSPDVNEMAYDAFLRWGSYA